MSSPLPAVRAQVSGLSDIGMVRGENQDTLLIREPDDGDVLRSRGVLLAVADGMGGLKGGKIASELAVDSLTKHYYEAAGDVANVLVDAVKEANQQIFRYSKEQAGGQSMGSTITAMAILKDYAYIAQVGDSRAYRYRQGELRQITTDHSLFRELQEQGQITGDLGSFQLHRNVLTRGLGLREDVEVDLFELNDLADGDLLVLSSDGLHEVINEDELSHALENHGRDLDGLCRNLVDRARKLGGPDNITTVVARLVDPTRCDSTVRPANASSGEGSASSWFLPVALFLTFMAGVAATLLFEARPADPEKLDAARQKVDVLLEDLQEGSESEELRSRLTEIREALER